MDGLSRALISAGPRISPDSGAASATTAVTGCIQLLSTLTILQPRTAHHEQGDAAQQTVTQTEPYAATLAALREDMQQLPDIPNISLQFSVLAAPGVASAAQAPRPAAPTATQTPLLTLTVGMEEGQPAIVHAVALRSAAYPRSPQRTGRGSRVRMVLVRGGRPIADQVCELDHDTAASHEVLPGVRLGQAASAIAR